MWLRNWYSILNAIFLSRTGDAIPGTNPSDEPAISYRRVTGEYYKLKTQTNTSQTYNDLLTPGKFSMSLGTTYDAGAQSKYYIIFGTGITPVTSEDYRIETPIASGLALASESTTLVNKTALSNGHYSFKTRIAVNNTSAAQITINEVALNAPWYAGTEVIAAYTCCVYREVLSSPITLDPGDTVLVEFEWDAPMYQVPTP